MSQLEFEEFMAAQVAAMVASGLGEDEWIAQEAERFRAEWMNLFHVEHLTEE